MAPNPALLDKPLFAEALPLPLPSLANEPLSDILRLIRTPNVGPMTCFGLIHRYGSAREALTQLPMLSLRGGRNVPLAPCTRDDAEKEIDATLAFGARFLVYGQSDYPVLLHMIPDPPPVITVMGNISLWKKQGIAIVGARNASANGCAMAQRLASDLGAAGVLVISGLARGIDTFAHKGSLATGTVAVIANGIDRVYPPENDKLADAIRANGVIITEQPFGSAPFAAAFPGRNRIIAGMSLGTLVVEAAPKSGSLITARLAAEQGRDVFAVPGHPLDPRAKGCNRLLKSGAILVESAEDVLHTLSLPRTRDVREIPPASFTPPPTELSDGQMEHAQHQLLSRLGHTPVSVEVLRLQCSFTPGMVSALLLELELAGKILRMPGGMVCLRMEA